MPSRSRTVRLDSALDRFVADHAAAVAAASERIGRAVPDVERRLAGPTAG